MKSYGSALIVIAVGVIMSIILEKLAGIDLSQFTSFQKTIIYLPNFVIGCFVGSILEKSRAALRKS